MAMGLCIPRAQAALIGGTPAERQAYAVKLRRYNISTFVEIKDRKRDKMVKRAHEESACVIDIDDPEERAWLDRESGWGDDEILRARAELDKPYLVNAALEEG